MDFYLNAVLVCFVVSIAASLVKSRSPHWGAAAFGAWLWPLVLVILAVAVFCELVRKRRALRDKERNRLS